MAPRLSVVVMAFNEAQSLDQTVAEIVDTVNGVHVEWELLLVDDGSYDGSERLADSWAERDSHVRVIHHTSNLGLGGVYRTGFRETRGEFVTFFPADGQFPAAIIADFLPRMERCDLVLGYLRRRRGAFLGRMLSLAERAAYRVLVGPMPRFQGILMFRRALLAHHTLHSAGRGWAVLLEFIIRSSRTGCRVENAPTEVRARAHGVSKVNNARTIWSNLQQVLTLRRALAEAG